MSPKLERMSPDSNVIRLRAGDRAVKGFVDETGDSITAFIPSQKGRKKKARQKNMSMVDTRAMTRLELSMVEARVFWRIVSHIPPRSGSVAFCSVSGLAEELGMHVSDVSKTIKALRARYIIRTIRRGEHHVNTWITYSGSFDEWNATDDTEIEPIWARHAFDPDTGVII